MVEGLSSSDNAASVPVGKSEESMSPFSVLIVEDQARFREAFTHALGSVPDIELLGIAPDLPQGRRMFDQLQPDVLLVDLDLPGGSGIELIRHAAQTRPQC